MSNDPHYVNSYSKKTFLSKDEQPYEELNNLAKQPAKEFYPLNTYNHEKNKRMLPNKQSNIFGSNDNPHAKLTSQLYAEPAEEQELPCRHYKPPVIEIKTWMFDGFREWCKYCNQLTSGENLIRTGNKLSGRTKNSVANSSQNRSDYDENNTSDLEMEDYNPDDREYGGFFDKARESYMPVVKNTVDNSRTLVDIGTDNQTRPLLQMSNGEILNRSRSNDQTRFI